MSAEFRPSRSFVDQADDDPNDEYHGADLSSVEEEEPEVHRTVGGGGADLLLILDCTRRNATVELTKFGEQSSSFITGRSAKLVEERVLHGKPFEVWTAATPAHFEPIRHQYGVKRPPPPPPPKGSSSSATRRGDLSSFLYI